MGLTDWFLSVIDPHRIYMGESQDRSVIFWTELISFVVGASIYRYTNSYIAVAGGFLAFHFLDFAFWYVGDYDGS